MSLAPGPDGRPRCWWAVSAPEYLLYHDDEWGRPVVDDDGVYERLCLEAFQSGLSWLTILRKREGFRSAFAGFRIDSVAAFDRSDVRRLLGDPGIVRNRAKVLAAIENARAAVRLRESGTSVAELVWSFRPPDRAAPREDSEVPAAIPQSAALARELKRHGFRFIGPTTAYATMQACGLVNDHLRGCVVRGDVERARRGTGTDREPAD